MGKTIADKTQAVTLEPININPTTLNNYKDNTLLSNNELEVAQNVIFDNIRVEKSLGTEKKNNDVEANVVTGLHRSYGNATEKVCLRLAGGTLKSGPPAFATTVLSNLSTTKITPFVNVRGKAWGVNETDGIIRYDPKTVTGLKTNIVCPYQRKKIAFFESDETWIGGTADTGVFRAEEWTGNTCTSRKVAAAVSDHTHTTRNVVLDLSVFDDGKTSTDEDYICFSTMHDFYNHIDAPGISIEFSTGDTTFAVKFQADLYQTDFEDGDYEWTHWKVKKGAFIATGAAAWNAVKSVRLTSYANANGACTIWFDFMYLKISPPTGWEIRKQIFGCESNTGETWAGDGTLNTVKAKEGKRSIRVEGTGAARTITCTLTTALNLSTWINEASTPVTDELVFDIYASTGATAKLTNANCLTLNIGADAANYWTYTWVTKDALGLIGDNQWIEVRIKKDTVDAAIGAGAPVWTNIGWIQFVTSVFADAGTYHLYFDNMRMEKYNQFKQICTFEPDETSWVITGGGELSTDKKGVTEGTQCIKLWASTVRKKSESSALYDCAVIDMTQFADATTSDTEDWITFDIYCEDYTKVDYVELWFDNNSLATFVNAYKYRMTKDQLKSAGGSTRSGIFRKAITTFEVKTKKSNFEQIGAAGGWSTIGAIKVVYYGNGGRTSGFVTIDNIVMKRRQGLTGRYYYKYTFAIGDVQSATSEISEYVDTKNNTILVQNIATSADTTRVTSRFIYRLGGSYPETWMLVKEIHDNTTTSFVDDIDDQDLPLSMGDAVPQGTTDGILCANLIYNPSEDAMIYWGNPTYLNRVYQSHGAYYYAVDATGYRQFPEEVMGVVPWYGQIIIIYKRRIQKIIGDLMTGQLVDLPVNFGACSFYASKPIRNAIIIGGFDNVYFFDGYNGVSIGDQVKGYFIGRETYLTTVNVGYTKETIYIACKDKTGIPTANGVVLRYYLPTKSWSIMVLGVNVWSNWDGLTDLNELYYGSSTDGNIYSMDFATYQFGGTIITSVFSTGWLSNPDSEIAIHHIELKAKGTAAATITFKGYKNLSGVASSTGTITLTTSWQTFVIGPKNIWNLLRGDHLKIEFTHATDSTYFYMKDIVVYIEKLSKRITLNEVTVT